MRHERPKQELHERVRAHVDKSGLTIAEIARRAGMPERRLCRLLNGDTRVLGDDIEVLAPILGKRIDRLFDNPSRRRAS